MISILAATIGLVVGVDTNGIVRARIAQTARFLTEIVNASLGEGTVAVASATR